MEHRSLTNLVNDSIAIKIKSSQHVVTLSERQMFANCLILRKLKYFN